MEYGDGSRLSEFRGQNVGDKNQGMGAVTNQIWGCYVAIFFFFFGDGLIRTVYLDVKNYAKHEH